MANLSEQAARSTDLTVVAELPAAWRAAVLAVRHASWVEEAAAQLRIAGPLILAALVNVGMAITDVIMMGWLGPVALAAGAVVSDFYSIVFYLCAGVIGAVSILVAQARGGRQHRLIRRVTQQGFWAVALLGVPGSLIVWQAPWFLSVIGVAPGIIQSASEYARMMALTLIPMLGVTVWRHFLSAHANTQMIFRITLVILVINAVGNYVFMFGVFGLPTMGVAGAGLSSALCAVLMFTALCAYVVRNPVLRRYRLGLGWWQPDWQRLAELFRMGAPIGVSSLGEVGVYLLSTAVISIFGADALAAHAVALRTAGVLYSVPLGLSQAATVRVGLALGAGNQAAQINATRTALAMAVGAGILVLMIVMSARFDIAALFVHTNGGSAHIIASAGLLLLVLASLQVFEYLGTVTAGVLRGFKDTRVPMLISVAAFWGVATLTGLSLGFGLQQEALGIWIGLGCGAAFFCIMLLARLIRFRV